jgi:hypothetical protein
VPTRRAALLTLLAAVALLLTAYAVWSARPASDRAVEAEGSNRQPRPAADAGVPATPIPCRGVDVRPGDDVQAALRRHPPGATFCFARGVYRISQALVPREGQRLIGQRGAVISGARPVVGFQRVHDGWVASGQLFSSGPHDYDVGIDCDPLGTDHCRYNDAMFYDGRPLRRVMSLPDVVSGTFYQDYRANRIYIGDDPGGHDVELAVASQLLTGNPGIDDVKLEGLTFEKAAANGNTGMVQANDVTGWVIEHCEIRLSHGIGLFVDSATMVANHVHDNGALGLAGHNGGLVVRGNEVDHNNWADYWWGWQAGGEKWVRTTDMRVSDEYVHDNNGNGVWFDIDNVRPILERSLIVDNRHSGIEFEISYDGTFRDNVIAGNGSVGLDAGIYVRNSVGATVYRNVVTDNHNGIVMERDPLKEDTGRYGPYDLARNQVYGNAVTMTRGFSGLRSSAGDPSYWSSKGNEFEGNEWRLDHLDAPRFMWRENRLMTGERWRQLGQDPTGTFALR